MAGRNRQTGAGHIAKADLHDSSFGRREGKKKKKRKRKEEENVVRDTGSAPPYRTVLVLVPYSPVPKASRNLGAKPLEITLGFAVLGATNAGWNRRVIIDRSGGFFYYS
jgi:hypothetical protein